MNPSRQAYLVEKYTPKLQNKLIEDQETKTPKRAFRLIRNIDPCKKGKHTDWLIRRFLSGEIKLTDNHHQITEALTLFQKYKRFSKVNDINKITSLASLLSIINPFKYNAPTSNRKKKQQLKEQLLSNKDIELLMNHNGVQLYKVNSEQGAIFLGRGTRWCTASREDNHFEDYSRSGSLYVLLGSDGEKYQIHLPNLSLPDTRESLFCDANDDEVSTETIDQYNDIISDFLLVSVFTDNPIGYEMGMVAVQLKGSHLTYIPNKTINFKLCLAAVKQTPWAIKYVPERFKRQELFEALLNHDDFEFDEFPELFTNNSFCLAAVKEYGAMLKYVPEKFKTLGLCRHAVKSFGSSLQHVPESLKELSLCRLAIKCDGKAYSFVPEHLRCRDIKKLTVDYFNTAVRKNYSEIADIPIDILTTEHCLIAVKQKGIALALVPKQFKTMQVCNHAIQQDISALKYVPEEFVSHEICMTAVEVCGLYLLYVPQKFRTHELCLTAVKDSGTALEYVPDELKTRELCKIAVEKNTWAINYVPEKHNPDIRCPEQIL